MCTKMMDAMFFVTIRTSKLNKIMIFFVANGIGKISDMFSFNHIHYEDT